MPIEVIYPRKINESAKDYSFKNLLFNIATNILPPGAAIEEAYIANKLNVSRTPVREAILRLNREHLIDILPQKSTTVSLIDVDFIEQGLFALQAIERAMIETCSHFLDNLYLEKMDTILTELPRCIELEDTISFFQKQHSFHFLLFKGCKKEKVFDGLQYFYYHILRELMVAPDVFPLTPLVDNAKGMVDAFMSKDVKKALMYHTFYMEHLSCDHEILKTAHPSYFPHM